MSSSPPKVSEWAIRDRFDSRSYERGQTYFRQGRIVAGRRQGNTLKARCEGSQEALYRVQATLDDGAIVADECSCPLGGRCKHVVALLLTWRARPEELIEVEDLDTALERRGKNELIALVKQMLRRAPELESLVEAPVPGAKRPANPDLYRRQFLGVLREGWDYEEGFDEQVAGELEGLLEEGDALLNGNDVAGAAAVYEGFVAAVAENSDEMPGDGMEEVGERCIAGLRRCLELAKNDPVRREAVLRALFKAFQAADFGLAEPAAEALVTATTPEERWMLAGWVRKAMPKGGVYDSWKRDRYARFLMRLEAEVMDDEAYLRNCRECGLTHELVERLLKLGRVDEAVATAAGERDFQLLQMADLLVEAGHADRAEEMVRTSKNFQWNGNRLPWLKKRAEARKDRPAVLKLAEEIFAERPSMEGYQEIRKLTAKADWPEKRERLLAGLEKSGNGWLLVDIRLKEGEIAEALELVKRDRWAGRALDVAKAAEAEFPREAMAIYRKQAERLIEHRSREYYREACKLLVKVRDLSAKVGETEQFVAYVAGLREKYRTLRALQEEMTSAKLNAPEAARRNQGEAGAVLPPKKPRR